MAKKQCTTLVIILSCLMLGACSFSTSSKHSSKSSSSPCRSSSRDSGDVGDGGEFVKATTNSYQEEIASLTSLHVGSQTDSKDFQRELGQISISYGVADWENRMKTYDAIGMGLQRANVTLAQIDSLEFLQGLSDSVYYSHITMGLE